MYTPEIAEAHKKGYFHIHDLSHGVIGYCCGHSLKNLLIMGFGGVRNKTECKPAKHLSTVVHQMVNYIGCLQMEFAGAQAFSSVDTLLAPFVREDKLSFKEVKQAMQQLVFSLNIPSRWGSQYPFSNITFDWKPPLDLKDQKAIVGGKEMSYTYGDTQKEMDMINKAFLEVMLEGDAKGGVFTFPIPTYNITKDFDWDSENANLLFDLTAKYGLPYFQNYVGSGLDPRSIRAMCCRLNLNQKELMSRPGGMWGPGDSTGSIGVVTLNLNRLAYEAKKAAEGMKSDDPAATARANYFEKLKYFMILAKNSLEVKREVVEKNLAGGLMPYTKRYLGTFSNHFSTIGLCGMNEACLNLIGKDIASHEGKQLAVDTLMFMRGMCLQFQNDTKNLYNLEATPAESTAYRFARLDKQMYPDIITSGTKEPYLTNSTQLPVDYSDDAIAAIEHQNDLQPLYTGGTIFHTFMGERLTSGESCKKLVRKIAENTKLPYFSITPTFSVCPTHGYVKGEHFTCPVEEGREEAIEVAEEDRK
jgi:ribonucleoside-triphosphate reductase